MVRGINYTDALMDNWCGAVIRIDVDKISVCIHIGFLLPECC